MTLVDGTGGNKSKEIVIGILILFITLAVAAYAIRSTISLLKPSVECTVPQDLHVTYDRPQELDKLQGSFWACNALICKRTMTPQEWTNKFCSNVNGDIICRVKAQDGTTYNVPINRINITATNDCAEYYCMQETLVRNASYVIPAP